ncbi:hypothetical protein IU443_18630 [Nocardia farcinica]|uniref:hypothetical protein n=1 Tax=Nocardia farcinica TaxID=37329 RepID=UPI001893C1FE|nr:hypothetical protein [Nocardia farcinica]MBF6264321.1 hypothetical protein [Nocardia farcinica]MBF6282529.1 hypothetical protein [Nocardia farcinica]MBF6307649.1 hypothetical protein [Nocardia farcinica]MBF6391964.1 hypothetical protein [Nocardia farcinica]MBF6489900.1 hypothetical protein [Nocardia farcinica]
MAQPERREQLELDEGGSWAIPTDSGFHYQLLLDGDDKRIIRLAVDTGHSYPDGSHPLRRDGEALPLLGVIDPAIQVGSPAYFVIGGVPDHPDYLSATRATSPVVEIRPLG